MLTRRHFLQLAGFTLAANCLGTEDTQARPNLLIVFPDQMRAQALGFMGMDPVKTPNLDAFAKTARVFQQGVSNYPVCSPFRAIFMSGALPWVSGVVTNCMSTEKKIGCELGEKVPCWSDVLHTAGYTQYYVGKWHLDAPQRPWIPTYNNSWETKWNEWCAPARRHGFDKWYSYGTYDNHLRPMYWDTNDKRDDFHYVNQWGPVHEADKAIEFLKTVQGPFSLVVSMNPPHTGYELVPKRYFAQYQQMPESEYLTPAVPPKGTAYGDHYRKFAPYYFAAVTGIDEQFGRILAALEASGKADNTIVCFFSDHGCNLGAHGLPAKNNPYEESMRIPYMVRWPKKIAPKMESKALVDAFDLAPTLLGLTGQEKRIPASMLGRNLAPYLLGQEKADLSQPCLYFHIGKISPVDEVPDIPYGMPTQWPTEPHAYGRRGLRTDTWTVSFTCKAKGAPLKVHFLDRTVDPYGLKNLAGEQPERMKQLARQLGERLHAIGDPFATLLKVTQDVSNDA